MLTTTPHKRTFLVAEGDVMDTREYPYEPEMLAWVEGREHVNKPTFNNATERHFAIRQRARAFEGLLITDPSGEALWEWPEFDLVFQSGRVDREVGIETIRRAVVRSLEAPRRYRTKHERLPQ